MRIVVQSVISYYTKRQWTSKTALVLNRNLSCSYCKAFLESRTCLWSFAASRTMSGEAMAKPKVYVTRQINDEALKILQNR